MTHNSAGEALVERTGGDGGQLRARAPRPRGIKSLAPWRHDLRDPWVGKDGGEMAAPKPWREASGANQ